MVRIILKSSSCFWFMFPFLLALSACSGKGRQIPGESGNGASAVTSLAGGQSSLTGGQSTRNEGQSNGGRGQSTVAGQASASDKEVEFPFPTIPITLVSQEERLQYLFTHYWDEYDFTDTARIHTGNVTEQALVNYFYLLDATEPEEASESLRDLVKKMKADAVVGEWFREKMEHYLYEPNSPMRNDDYYRTALEAMLSGSNPKDFTLERLRFQLKTLRTNMKGTKASNFPFKTAGGEKTSLWKLQSNYTLLLLYDPDCSNCRHAIETLSVDSRLASMCRASENGIPVLTVLTVAVEGDEDKWFDHLPSLPADWLNGYDEGFVIRDRELYDLRSVPSMYLLDKDKKVLVRDANAPDILEYLINTGN